MKKTNSGETFSNLLWRFAERCGAHLVQFVVSIILARILAPELYGTIALITVFTTILNVFVDSGMGNALIQKKDADDLDFSSVFYFNISICVLLYILMFFLAPAIAAFYKRTELINLIRVLSLTLVISGVKNIQQAYVSKHMLFKRFFFSTLGGTVVAAIVGITLAYSGFGVWALVAQQLTNVSIDTLILWITVKWRPRLVFSLKRLKLLYSYGWKLLASALVETVYKNLRQLIIGKKYSTNDLAFYNRGDQFPSIVISNINSSIDSVLFPVMSQAQDSAERVKEMTRRAIRTSSYIMAPLLMGLAFTSETVVSLLLTDKWLECVPFLKIFCITYMFYPIHTSNLNAIKALGRSDLFLKLEILKKTVGLILLLSSMWFGVMAMAHSLLVGEILSQIINTWPNKKLLNYRYIDQIKDILPNILLAVFMGVCVWPISLLDFGNLLKLLIQVLLGIGIYILVSVVFKFESFYYLLNIFKGYIKK